VKAWIDAYHIGQGRGEDLGVYSFTPEDPKDFDLFNRLEQDPESTHMQLKDAARKVMISEVTQHPSPRSSMGA
jgi:hypothetical protein